MTGKPPAFLPRRGEIVAAALVVASSLAWLAAREMAVGQREDAAAEAAVARSQWIDAIAHSRSAAEAVAPWSPWPERGAHRLEALARDAEARGDDVTALLAWGALRSAAIATRSLGPGGIDWRTAADHGIDRVAAWRRDTSSGATTGPAAAEPLRIALGHDDAPSTGSLALLAAALVAAVAGLAGLTRTRTAEAGARMAVALVAGGFLAYAAGLLLN
jgi:hypothetical protein